MIFWEKCQIGVGVLTKIWINQVSFRLTTDLEAVEWFEHIWVQNRSWADCSVAHSVSLLTRLFHVCLSLWWFQLWSWYSSWISANCWTETWLLHTFARSVFSTFLPCIEIGVGLGLRHMSSLPSWPWWMCSQECFEQLPADLSRMLEYWELPRKSGHFWKLI